MFNSQFIYRVHVYSGLSVCKDTGSGERWDGQSRTQGPPGDKDLLHLSVIQPVTCLLWTESSANTSLEGENDPAEAQRCYHDCLCGLFNSIVQPYMRANIADLTLVIINFPIKSLSSSFLFSALCQLMN